jgi:subtilisin family serine protease
VAKDVKLVAVRVLDCGGSGSWSGVIDGIDWVVENHQDGALAVANMSLGGGASAAVDAAVSNAIADGITFAVAAGNSNADACRFSPARVLAALTVGATTSSDAKASYSNFGKCVDLFAPGSSITSAWIGGNATTNTISGTSMATPHVAGVVALALAAGKGAAAVVDGSTRGKVIGLGSKKTGATPNLLLYTEY